MIFVGPEYLNDETLPYISDLLYHERLLYSLPVGFHPIEINSVIEFPSYCSNHSIALPKIIWDMCHLYFENSKASISAIKKIEPLRNGPITIVMLSYPRNRAAIEETANMIKENPIFIEEFKKVNMDKRFLARELLSHVLYEVFLEEGFQGAIAYLQEKAKTPDDFLILSAAVILNRLKFFTDPSAELILYEHSWYQAISEASTLLYGNNTQNDESDDEEFKIEHFRYKLFETILLPIFGKCDSADKANKVKSLLCDRKEEIISLKDECKRIATEVILLPTQNNAIREDQLRDLIKNKIADPLNGIVQTPKTELQSFIGNFLLDSTVIGGLLTVLQGFDASLVGTSAAAGFISSGIRNIIGNRSQKKDIPPKLIAENLRKSTKSILEMQDYLTSISISQVDHPPLNERMPNKTNAADAKKQRG